MKTLLQQQTLISNDLFRRRTYNAVSPETAAFEVPNLQSRVTLIANSIGDESVRIVVSKILADLVFLLDYLSLIEAHPREPNRIEERLSILEAVRCEAFSLVEFIENRAMRLEGMDERLRDALDGSAYAIQHELRRMFESELSQASSEEDDFALHGVLIYAQGVLTNCFQQCMMGLARLFDDGLTGERLFQDWRVKRERSLVLYRDLEKLVGVVQAGEAKSLMQIADQLRSFREGSMQWLMHKDWHEYQALAEPIINSIEVGKDPADLLHSLQCYLETLLAHVRARAVLADLVFEPCRSLEEAA